MTLVGSNCRDYEYRYPGTFSLFRCSVCELIKLHHVLSQEQLLSAYPAEYHGYNYDGEHSKIFNFLQALRLKKRLSFYRHLIPGAANVLDIGCGDGHYLDNLVQITGWTITGIEFKKEIAVRGIKQGRNILVGTFEEIEFHDNYFDLIIMNHLIEHVRDPIKLLEKAKLKLKADGYIIGELPNVESWDFQCFRKFWGGLHVPRHLHNFSPQALRLTAAAAGFDNCRITFNLNTSHWALSVQNLLQSSHFFKTGLHFGRTWYYNFLLVVFIPLNIVAKIFKKTGIMNFVIKK